MMLKNRLAGLVILLLIALAVFYAWWHFVPGHVEDGCNLHQRRCSAPFPTGGRVILSLAPHPLRYNEPWQVTVAFDGVPAQHIKPPVEIDFAGIDQPTSFNRVKLSADGQGHFTGEAVLPMCMAQAVAWQASVLVDKHITPFGFSSEPDTSAEKLKAITPHLNLESAPLGGEAVMRGTAGAFEMKQLRGKPVLLFFGTSATPPGCPQPIAVIDQAIAGLGAGEAEKIHVVMVALDAVRDAPEQLEPKLRAQHPVPYRVVTGAGADLIGMGRLYGAAFMPHLPEADGQARMDYAAIYYLLDRNGRLVDAIAGQSPSYLAKKLKAVLAAAH